MYYPDNPLVAPNKETTNRQATNSATNHQATNYDTTNRQATVTSVSPLPHDTDEDVLINVLNSYFRSNSVRYKDFCRISVNVRLDDKGCITGDSSSSSSFYEGTIPSLIRHIISVYSDETLCYTVDSNDIITGVIWKSKVYDPTVKHSD